MKIAVCITTFIRDNLLCKTTDSFKRYNSDFVMLIADQNWTPKKHSDFFNPFNKITYYYVPFDSGVSYGRNFLVTKANSLGCDFCLISADNINFTQPLDKIIPIIEFLNSNKEFGIVGLGLNYNWKFNLTIENGEWVRSPSIHTEIFKGQQYVQYDLVPNFFIAKTKVLLENKWDEELKTESHLDFFYRLKNTPYKVFYNDSYPGKREDEKKPDYLIYRNRALNEHRELVKKKYGLTGWIRGMK